MTSVIQLEQVSKRYPNGVHAVRDVSLTVETGRFLAILGPSGAGKSTLLRLMNGLETPTGGRVLVGGVPVAGRNLRRVRTQVGMVFQHFHLVGRLNVLTNVLTGRLAHVPSWMSLFYLFRHHDYAIAHEALARVDLVDKAWERADRLSGGQQQRVGIARALAQQPRVILADEPVASLDPVTSQEVMELLARIQREQGITLLVNLHQVEWARRYAERIVGLNAGQVVFDGPPDQLTSDVLQRIYEGNVPVLATSSLDSEQVFRRN